MLNRALSIDIQNSTSPVNSGVISIEHESHGAAALSFLQLFLAIMGPILVLILSIHLKLELASKIIVSVTRMTAQLLFAGCILLGLIFSIKSPILVVAYLCLMALIASHEVNARRSRCYKGQSLDALYCVLIGGGLVGAYGTIVVFGPHPWWNPQIMVPTAGMIIGGVISGPALSVERLLSEVSEKSHEPEVRLAFGCTKYEAVLPILRVAIKAALMPNLNTMAVVGLVSIPGMMTGQLLGGSSPYVAAEYQMAILWLLLTGTFISTYVALHLAVKNAVFDSNQRLAPSKILKVKESKFSLESWGQSLFLRLSTWMTSVMQHILYLTRKQKKYEELGQEVEPLTDVESANNPIQSHHAKNNSGSSSRDLKKDIHINPNQSFSSISPTRMTGSGAGVGGGGDDSNDATSSDSHSESGGDGHLYPTQMTMSDDSIHGYHRTLIKQILPNIPSSQHIHSHQLSSSRPFRPLLEVKDLNVLCGKKPLFHGEGFSFTLHHGEIMTIEGTSGIGKTRLLRAIAQLDAPLDGTMTVHCEEIVKSTGPHWRKRCMYIPQALPSFNGSPKDFVLECCQYKYRLKSPGTLRLVTNIDMACERIEYHLGLSHRKMSQKWTQLSGGQRQRCIIGCGLLLATTLSATSDHLSLYSSSSSTASSMIPYTSSRSRLHSDDSSIHITNTSPHISQNSNSHNIKNNNHSNSSNGSGNISSNNNRSEYDFIDDSTIIGEHKLDEISLIASTYGNTAHPSSTSQSSSFSAAIHHNNCDMTNTHENDADISCVILLDEPTAACDNETTIIVENALIRSRCSMILITHDERQASRIAHKRLIITSVESDKNQV